MLTFSPTRKWDLNLYMIKGEKNDFIIDTGCGGDDSEALVSFREKAGGEKPVVVINTHFHFDHVWGNRFFGNCTIIAHKECGRLMRDTKECVQKGNQKIIIASKQPKFNAKSKQQLYKFA